MKEIIPIEIELLTQIDKFCAEVKMSPSAFGTQACGDHKIIKKLRGGKGIVSGTINEIRGYIASREPADSTQTAAVHDENR